MDRTNVQLLSSKPLESRAPNSSAGVPRYNQGTEGRKHLSHARWVHRTTERLKACLMTTPKHKLEFTLRSANQTLPLVKMIVQDIVALSSKISDTRQRLDYLWEGRDGNDQDEYAKELSSIEQVTELQCDQVDRWIFELIELNLLTHGVDQGFVDFPALRDNKPICLCWRLGEKEVMHWHRVDQDCAERQVVDLPLIRQLGDCQISNSA